LSRRELVVSGVNGCRVNEGFGNGSLGFLEAMCELFDVADYLFEGSGGGLALGINAVQLALKEVVRLGREGGEGTRAEKHRDAGSVECIDVLRFVMDNWSVAKGLEVIPTSEEALSDLGSTKDNAIDSII